MLRPLASLIYLVSVLSSIVAIGAVYSITRAANVSGARSKLDIVRTITISSAVSTLRALSALSTLNRLSALRASIVILKALVRLRSLS